MNHSISLSPVKRLFRMAAILDSCKRLLAASYLAGFFRKIIGGKGKWPTVSYAEPIHDGWPSHNAGWPDLTTTRVKENSPRVGPDGRVYMVGVGPRMVTTSNAHQKLPRRLGHNNPVLNEGTCPWNNWVRAYEPDPNALAYSSTITGVWTYPDDNVNADPVGADNTVLQGVFPVSGGLLVVGQHSNGRGTTAAGNNIPTANVPAWGAEGYSGISGIFGLLPFSDRRPTAAFAATQGAAGVQFDGTGSQSIATIASYQWDFGDGSTGSGQTATHSYAESGTYLVGLRVINEDGLEATSHQWLEVAEVAEPAAVPVVVISGPLEGSAALVISFPSAIGRNYQLQISGTLAGSGWADTGAVMAGTGGELTVEVAAATAEPVFYRVVVLDTGG